MPSNKGRERAGSLEAGDYPSARARRCGASARITQRTLIENTWATASAIDRAHLRPVARGQTYTT